MGAGQFGSIFIGVPIQRVLALNLGFYYDEYDEAFVSRGIRGIALEVSDEDPPPEETEQMNVKYITICDSKLFYYTKIQID